MLVKNVLFVLALLTSGNALAKKIIPISNFNHMPAVE